MIGGRADAGEGAQERIGRHSFLKGRVSLGIEGFSMGHAAAHPKHDDSVGSRLNLLFFCVSRQNGMGKTSGQSGQCSRARGFQKIAASVSVCLDHNRSILMARNMAITTFALTLLVRSKMRPRKV